LTSDFSESITIGCTSDAAFAYLADPANATTLDPVLISYEPDRVPMMVGTTNRIRFRMLGRPIGMTTHVRQWDIGKRMVIDTISPSRPFRATAIHTFETRPGGTLYTWAMEFRSTSPGGTLFAMIACRLMRRAVRGQQKRFKEIMERQ